MSDKGVLGVKQGPTHADVVAKMLYNVVAPATPDIFNVRSWAPAATHTLVHVTSRYRVHVRGYDVADNNTTKQMRHRAEYLDHIYKT